MGKGSMAWRGVVIVVLLFSSSAVFSQDEGTPKSGGIKLSRLNGVSEGDGYIPLTDAEGKYRHVLINSIEDISKLTETEVRQFAQGPLQDTAAAIRQDLQQGSGGITTETDPVWTAAKPNYNPATYAGTSTTDWDDLLPDHSQVQTASANNGPPENFLYYPITVNLLGNNRSQLALPYNGTKVWSRRRFNSIWTSWIDLTKDDNTQLSQAEVDAFNLALGYEKGPIPAPSPWTTETNNRIWYDNFVGVGAAPLYNLHVQSAVGNASIRATTNATGNRFADVVVESSGGFATFTSRGTGATGTGPLLTPGPKMYSVGQDFNFGTLSNRELIFVTNNTERGQIDRFGNWTIYDLAGFGNQMVVVNNSGELSTADLPSGDNLGDHTATQNIQLNSNYISNDGDDEGISIADNGNTTITGLLEVDAPQFFESTDNVTDGTTTRKVQGIYTGNISDVTGPQVPHVRKYASTQHYYQSDVAGSISQSLYAKSDLDARRGLANETATQAHVAFDIPSGSLAGINLSGAIEDSAGKVHFFSIGAGIKGNDLTSNTIEIISGPVTAEWYITTAGDEAIKVTAPTSSDWGNATIEVTKAYSSSITISEQLEFRNTEF